MNRSLHPNAISVPQITLRELFKIVTAAGALYAWMTRWSEPGMRGILVGSSIAAAILFWPSRDDVNWLIQIKRSIASLLLAISIGLLSTEATLVGGAIIAALLIWPNHDDQHWALRYAASNTLLSVAMITAIIFWISVTLTGR
jgi:hypothetical protein